ncbi:hypothetical protein HDV05_003599 [Chytridiales sp. JEL 0842]|nr:hypothetical protein HDV05_003599 [Chytridiales sp. JEL 0842]
MSMKFTIKKVPKVELKTPASGFAVDRDADDTLEGARGTKRQKGNDAGVIEIVSGEGIIHSDGSHIPKKPLVIPLKVQNEWRNADPSLSMARNTTNNEASNGHTSTTTTAIPATIPQPTTNLDPNGNELPKPDLSTIPIATTNNTGKKIWGLQIMKKRTSAPQPIASNSTPSPPPPASNPKSLDEQAIEALVTDAKYGPASSIQTVPILQQNALPGLEDITDPKEKYLYDMKHRPDEVTEEDYDQIPIEDFGKAMVRGMGWRDEDHKEDGFVFHKPRPNLLGLGAQPPPPKKDKKKGGYGPTSNSSTTATKPPSKPDTPPSSSRSSKLHEGSRIRIRKSGKYYKKYGLVLSLRDKGSEGTVVKVEVDDDREVLRLWDDEVEII